MSLPAPSTRLPGIVLLVVLSPLSAVSPHATPTPALGTPGEVDPVGVWPLRPEPQVVKGFDPPLGPWGAGHRGVDLLGSVGQPVRAALPGRVGFVGMIAGRGVVTVDHGETRTTYEPVAASVAVGDRVRGGEVIASLALVGSHCFPRSCLHWGWIRGETYLDPLDLVGEGPVRLLPLWRDEPVSSIDAFRPASGRPLAAPQLPYADWQPLLRLLRPIGYLP